MYLLGEVLADSRPCMRQVHACFTGEEDLAEEDEEEEGFNDEMDLVMVSV